MNQNKAIHNLVLITCLVPLLARPLCAQDAAPADRNPVNTRVRPGDMMADSPVTFPKKGALPSKFPPDVKTVSTPTEKGYYLFSSPCRSLAQIKAIQAEMPVGEFTRPANDWVHLQRTHRILTEGGNLHVLGLGESRTDDTGDSDRQPALAKPPAARACR